MKPLIKKTYQFFKRIILAIRQRIAYYFLEPIIKEAYILEEVLVKGAEMSIFIDCNHLRRLRINGQKIKVSNGVFKACVRVPNRGAEMVSIEAKHFFKKIVKEIVISSIAPKVDLSSQPKSIAWLGEKDAIIKAQSPVFRKGKELKRNSVVFKKQPNRLKRKSINLNIKSKPSSLDKIEVASQNIRLKPIKEPNLD